jgi:hypothetical protein
MYKEQKRKIKVENMIFSTEVSSTMNTGEITTIRIKPCGMVSTSPQFVQFFNEVFRKEVDFFL